MHKYRIPQNHHPFCQENLQLCNLEGGAKSLEKLFFWCWFYPILLVFTGAFASGSSHQNIWVHSASSFLRVGVANVGSGERKEIVWFWKHVAMLALLARCDVPILSHEAAWNMMMFYLLSIKNDVTCSHFWCMRISLKISEFCKSWEPFNV